MIKELYSIHSAKANPFDTLDESKSQIKPEDQITKMASKIAGLFVIPSQLFNVGLVEANQIVERALQNLPDTIKRVDRIEISTDEGSKVQALLIYPVNCQNSKKCIVYNNPNTNTIPYYLSKGFETSLPPFQLLLKKKCPLLLYDYHGTGISRSALPIKDSSLMHRLPCVNTTAAEALAVLAYAMHQFDKVEVWGSSYGGGVATLACDAYLSENPKDAQRLRLFNHDSFTRIGAVLPEGLRFLTSYFGTELDAESAMRRLVAKGIETVILCHRNDPVIGKGAQMAEIVPSLQGKVRLIDSPHFSHAALLRICCSNFDIHRAF